MANDSFIEDYLDLEDEKVVGLYLSVQFWGMIAQNPNANPTSIDKVLETANRFSHYLVHPYVKRT